jgi:mevalonate kinase
LENRIYSPGKLLITSEYFVLDGALALAVPTKLGQELLYSEVPDQKSNIYWTTKVEGQKWFTLDFCYKNWEIIATNDFDRANFILGVLKNVQQLSNLVLQEEQSYVLSSNIEFPADYGLGSSSTLMNNLAEWAQIDAFHLNDISLGGSGYDVAVAQEKSAILYQNNPREIQKIEFKPQFSDELILVYLNQKQDSREGIKAFRSQKKSLVLRDKFSEITNEVIKCNDLGSFSELMILHESMLSEFLNLETVKQKYFEDAPFFVKSLGAWGGDFVLSAKFGDYKNYFFEKGFTKVFNYKDLVY